MSKRLTRQQQARAQASARSARRRRNRMMAITAAAASVAVAGLILAGMLLRGSDQLPDRMANTEGRILGDISAPVVISVWEDFQCPVCKAANQSVLAQIEEDYVNSGVVQVHYRHFAFLGDESVAAAEASECAAEQHMFWPYHDRLFASQAGENRGAFSESKLKSIAADIGLDGMAFDECFDGSSYARAIADEKKEGEALGVNATPTFFVGDKRVSDWRDYEAVRQLIEQEIQASR